MVSGVRGFRFGGAGTHDSMEFASFVALWTAEMVLCLTGAELTEVLGGLGDYIGEELELDTSQRFS